MYQNISVNLNLPVAVRRERPQSVTDRETELQTGQARNGDAAFADYVINLAVTYRFSNNKVALDPALQDPFNNN
jgi:uncharacterized protein YjbK